jgi:hypothetical protein
MAWPGWCTGTLSSFLCQGPCSFQNTREPLVFQTDRNGVMMKTHLAGHHLIFLSVYFDSSIPKSALLKEKNKRSLLSNQL